MIEVARPAILGAGILLAAVPLVLHLLRPRERERRPLPTARFLTPTSRTRLAFHRLPDHPLLLALRMGLCVVLGAALSGLNWVGPSEGTGHVVVVDGGAGLAEDWADARAAVVEGLGPGPVWVVVVRPGPPGTPPRAERLAGERAPTGEGGATPDGAPGASEWAELAPAREGLGEGEGALPGEARVRLSHLLRALRDEAGRVTGVDSIAARVVTRPHWSAWGPGLPELRAELWPAGVELVVPELPADRAAPAPEVGLEGVRLELEAPEELRGPLLRALDLLGVPSVSDSGEGPPEGTTATGPDPLPESEEAVAGAGGEPPFLVRLAVGPARTLPAPWRAEEPGTATEPGAEPPFLLLDGRILRGAGPVPQGTPAPEATVPLLRAGGRPGAAAVRSDGECRLALPLEPEAPMLTGEAVGGELVLLLEALLYEGCGLTAGGLRGSGADETGAADAFRAFLEDEDRPGALEAAPLRDHRAGVPLTRFLLLVALVLAGLEWLRVRRLGETAEPGDELREV